jgi:hypothetical protein
VFRWIAVLLSLFVIVTTVPVYPTYVDAGITKQQKQQVYYLLQDWKRQEAYYMSQLQRYPGNRELLMKLEQIRQIIRNLENQLKGD